MSTRAKKWAEAFARFARGDSLAFRFWDGAPDGESSSGRGRLALDALGEDTGGACFRIWVSLWDLELDRVAQDLKSCFESLRTQGVVGAVTQSRKAEANLPHSHAFWGEIPSSGWVTREGGLKFEIRFKDLKHPGLFLDHAPLRSWLLKNSSGLRVLNTFAYTGSLSVASGVGGARETLTLDLSKTTLDWAKRNWELNGLSRESAKFYAEDVLAWLPREARRVGEGKSKPFDLIILDPPSFSRSKNGVFSTAKDTIALHRAAFGAVAPGGLIATSINSDSISARKFAFEVAEAAKLENGRLEFVHEIQAPEPFRPDHVKGAIYRWQKNQRARAPRRSSSVSKWDVPAQDATSEEQDAKSRATIGRISDPPKAGASRRRPARGSDGSARSRGGTRPK